MPDDPPPVPGLDPVEMMAEHHPTFLVGETMTRTVLAAKHGEQGVPRIATAINGKWNHGAEDRLVLLMAPDNAVAIAATLIEAAIDCGPNDAVLTELLEASRRWGAPDF